MVLPVILVDSNSGSDTTSSGAGNGGTAVSGSKGRTRSAAGEVRVGFFEASPPDLSAVSTSGGDVLYIAISTAGARNFSAITGTVKNTNTADTLIAATNSSAVFLDTASGNYSVGDVVQATNGVTTLYTTVASISAGVSITMNDTWGGTTGNVTLTNPRQISLLAGQGLNTGGADTAWAIGGKRATVAGTNSLKLFNNNGGSGDAMPGWTVEMQSAHSETITSPIDMRRNGDTTTGQITLRGKVGAATSPVIHVNGAINAIVPRGTYQSINGFTISAENAAVSSAIVPTVASIVISGIKLTRTSTNKFTQGFVLTSSAAVMIHDCEIAYCTTGINVLAGAVEIFNNWFHDISANGIDGFTDELGIQIQNNILYGCGGKGINCATWGTTNRAIYIIGNTIDSSTGDGITISSAPGDGLKVILNNILSNNGGYGLNFSSGSATDVALIPRVHIQGNNTYLNTSNAYKSATSAYANNACPWASGDPGLNPSYTSASTGNFMIGTNLKGQGYPVGGTLAVGTTSLTYSYEDTGAAQRQETGGGGATYTGFFIQ